MLINLVSKRPPRRPVGNRRVETILLVATAGVCLAPGTASALQSHGPPEGLFAHQLAHVFFALSMAILAYWLESHGFTRDRGWRLVQLSCVLFLFWNIAAFSGHFIEGRISPDLIVGQKGTWNQRLIAGSETHALAYYFLKLDHLLCVPAILCLFLGLRSHYRRTLMEAAQDE